MQLDLLQPAAEPHGVDPTDQANFRAHLISHGWQTRREIREALGWDDRKIRLVAESLGTDVIRCQLGYLLTASATRDDVPYGLQACDAFQSQARKNIEYAMGLRRRLHAIVG